VCTFPQFFDLNVGHALSSHKPALVLINFRYGGLARLKSVVLAEL
jgi:hypothetical protein